MRKLIEHEKPLDQQNEVKEFVIIRPKERKMFSGIQKDIKVKIDGYAGNRRLHDEYQAGVKCIRNEAAEKRVLSQAKRAPIKRILAQRTK